MHRILRCKYLQGGHLYANYREILRLYSLGLNKTEIASNCRCARNTVAATLQRAANCGLQWPLPEEMSDKQLSERLFPTCLLYTSDAADDLSCVDLGGRRIIKKKIF